MKQDDGSNKHRNTDGEFSLEELIADFASGKGTGELVISEEDAAAVPEFGISLDESEDAEEQAIPTEEIDADATGEYSRIISEYAASVENDDPDEDAVSAEIVDISEDELVDIGESTREFLIDDMKDVAMDSETGVIEIAEAEGDELTSGGAFPGAGSFKDDTPVPAEMAGVGMIDDDEAPTPIDAFITADSAVADEDDGIPDLADLRASMTDDEHDDHSGGSGLFEKLELGPVIDGMHMVELDGDTIDIPGFDPDDPLGMFGGDRSPERTQSVSGDDDEAPADDFLGLGSIRTGVRKGAAAEVLFDGVTMSFDDQIRKVTLAEILLAQGHRDKATDLYEEVADRGATFWVDKRVEELLGRR